MRRKGLDPSLKEGGCGWFCSMTGMAVPLNYCCDIRQCPENGKVVAVADEVCYGGQIEGRGLLSYESFVIRNGKEAALAVLDIADLISLRERGYPIRRWGVIESGSLPQDDDFADADDPLIDQAIRAFKSGERGERLTGKGFEENIIALTPRLPEWVPGSARDDYELDLTFDMSCESAR